MIQQIQKEDVEAVIGLEKECFSDPWSRDMLKETMGNGLDVLFVEKEEGQIRGYCIFRILAGEGELLRIGAGKGVRRQGIGRKLMDAMAVYSRNKGVSAISLEVREGNLAARNLYLSCGFKEEAVRKGYYQNPKEDAVIMWKRGI